MNFSFSSKSWWPLKASYYVCLTPFLCPNKLSFPLSFHLFWSLSFLPLFLSPIPSLLFLYPLYLLQTHKPNNTAYTLSFLVAFNCQKCVLYQKTTNMWIWPDTYIVLTSLICLPVAYVYNWRYINNLWQSRYKIRILEVLF